MKIQMHPRIKRNILNHVSFGKSLANITSSVTHSVHVFSIGVVVGNAVKFGNASSKTYIVGHAAHVFSMSY